MKSMCWPAVAAMTLASCVMIQQLGNGGPETAASRSRSARWDGPECKRALYQLDELNGYDYNAKDTVEDNAPEAQVLLQVCTRREKPGYADHTVPQHPRIRELRVEDSYFAQDDRHLDVVVAAVFAVSQASRRGEQHWEWSMTKNGTGLALFWTQVVSPEQLANALANVKVPQGARDAMVALYRDVPNRLAGLLDAEDLKVYVDLPVSIYRARQEHYAKFSKFYDKLDQVRASAQAARDDAKRIDTAIAELKRLRSEFFAACAKIDCRSTPLYADATRELAQLHVLRGDLLAASAESALFDRRGGYAAGLAQAIRAAQEVRVHGLTEAWEKYRKAKDNGSDDKTARRLAGDVPAVRPEFKLLEPEMELPDYAAAIVKEHEPTAAHAFVDRAGGGRIVFKTDHINTEEPYDCQRTNRITRINFDGTIEYEENCKYRPATYSQEQHPPITVPAEEATGIRNGDLVSFMSHEGKSLVIEVKRGDKTIQVRGDRVR